MKALFLVLLLSGCRARAGAVWIYASVCSPDGVAYWEYGNRFAVRLDQNGRVVKCQP